MSEYVVSVVIPNHNYGKWIADAINSVANDKYPHKQIMIIDDGSTDDSWEVINKIGNISAEVSKGIYAGKVLNTPLLATRLPQATGPSNARNIGIKVLWNHTHVYGFLDADDMYLPGKIEKSIALFEEYPNRIGAVYTDYDTLSIDTGQLVSVYKEPYSRERLLQECIVHSSCMVSRLALEQCGLYDIQLRCAEDYDLWLRISEKFIVSHIPETLMTVRVGSHNSTATVSKEVWNQCLSRVRQKCVERNAG